MLERFFSGGTSDTKKTLEATSFLYAMIELLNEKGLISIEEMDERKKQVAGHLVKKFVYRKRRSYVSGY
jgi:hypothetical protein